MIKNDFQPKNKTNRMTHKEEMEYLKKYDPMLYYELNSDPTGTDISDDTTIVVLTIGLLLGIGGLVTWLFI